MREIETTLIYSVVANKVLRPLGPKSGTKMRWSTNHPADAWTSVIERSLLLVCDHYGKKWSASESATTRFKVVVGFTGVWRPGAANLLVR